MGVKLSKRYFSYSFPPISTKLHGKYRGDGGIQAITFLGDLSIMGLCVFLKYTTWSWKFQNATPTVFI